MKNNLFVLIVIIFSIGSIVLVGLGCGTNPTGGGGASHNGILYVLDSNNFSILMFDNANSSAFDSSIAPTRIVSGAATTLANPQYNGIHIDKTNNTLYVSNPGATSIIVYDNASTISGDLVPDRVIEDATNLLAVAGLFVKGDRLYVARRTATTPNILVYDKDSNGTTSPLAIVSTSEIKDVWDLYVDSNNNMYVAYREAPDTFDHIAVFSSVEVWTGTTTPTPTRIISCEAINSWPCSIYVDEAKDKLFTCSRNASKVAVFNNASTLEGNCSPDYTADLSQAMQIAYNPIADALYALSDSAVNIKIWDAASTIEGSNTRTVTPTISTALMGIDIDWTR